MILGVQQKLKQLAAGYWVPLEISHKCLSPEAYKVWGSSRDRISIATCYPREKSEQWSNLNILKSFISSYSATYKTIVQQWLLTHTQKAASTYTDIPNTWSTLEYFLFYFFLLRQSWLEQHYPHFSLTSHWNLVTYMEVSQISMRYELSLTSHL